MRFKVSLKKKGKEFYEVDIAKNKKEAMEAALKNNPEAQALNSDGHLRFNYLRSLRIKRDATQITLIAGPGERLKTIERINPRSEMHNPKNEDLIIAILKL